MIFKLDGRFYSTDNIHSIGEIAGVLPQNPNHGGEKAFPYQYGFGISFYSHHEKGVYVLAYKNMSVHMGDGRTSDFFVGDSEVGLWPGEVTYENHNEYKALLDATIKSCPEYKELVYEHEKLLELWRGSISDIDEIKLKGESR